MDLLQAIILGIVQGATEFLPVSSSGHLVLVPWWLGWEVPPDLVFDVATHLGTLCAVLIYFRQDWIDIARGAWTLLRTRRLADPHSRLFVYLIIGSIPVALAGLLLVDFLHGVFQQPVAAASFLFVTAGVLVFSERRSSLEEAGRPLAAVTALDALVIGLAQLLALFPGISRSGSTIAAGLVRGLNRADAARFSFLLSTPAILGAGLLTGLDLVQSGDLAGQLPILLAGFFAAGVVGYLAIAFLLNHLRQRRLTIFAAYCVLAGGLSLLAALLGR